MGGNIQHSTFNARHRMAASRGIGQRLMFAVRCSVFVVGAILSTAPQLLAGASTNTLLILAPPDGEMPPTFWEQHGTAILLGGIALIALAGLILWKRFQPAPAVVLTPEAVARQALEKLQGRREDGQVLSESSQILRRYFGAVLELPSAEMTTAEFCAALTAHDKIGGDLAQSAANLLSVCDKDKFSPKTIVPPINAVSRVHELVSRSEARLTQPKSVTPPQP